MTVRESIVRRKRKGAIVTYLGLAWFVAWMALKRGSASLAIRRVPRVRGCFCKHAVSAVFPPMPPLPGSDLIHRRLHELAFLCLSQDSLLPFLRSRSGH